MPNPKNVAPPDLSSSGKKKSFIAQFFTSEWVILAAISINCLILFLMGFDQFSKIPFLHLLDYFFTVFFLLEAVVKISQSGWRSYIAQGWNRLDFLIVLVSTPSLLELAIEVPAVSFVQIFRVLRLMRIFRFIRFIPNISHLISGLKRAMKASVFVLIALFIYNFLLAVITCHLFKSADPVHFGNPLISFYSIFTIFTVEGWTVIPERISANSTVYPEIFTRAYFIGVVLTGGIFGFSIVNAVFVDEMVIDNTAVVEQKVDDLSEKVDLLLKKMEEK